MILSLDPLLSTMRIPLPVKRLITSPRNVLLELPVPAASPSAFGPALMPFNSMSSTLFSPRPTVFVFALVPG